MPAPKGWEWLKVGGVLWADWVAVSLALSGFGFVVNGLRLAAPGPRRALLAWLAGRGPLPADLHLDPW